MDIENNVSEQLEAQKMSEDELKNVVEEQLSKIRSQSMLLGAQSICQVILNKINAFDRLDGKKTNNDHKRLIKDIRNFCEIGLSRKVNFDGVTESADNNAAETVQN